MLVERRREKSSLDKDKRSKEGSKNEKSKFSALGHVWICLAPAPWNTHRPTDIDQQIETRSCLIR